MQCEVPCRSRSGTRRATRRMIQPTTPRKRFNGCRGDPAPAYCCRRELCRRSPCPEFLATDHSHIPFNRFPAESHRARRCIKDRRWAASMNQFVTKRQEHRRSARMFHVKESAMPPIETESQQYPVTACVLWLLWPTDIFEKPSRTHTAECTSLWIVLREEIIRNIFYIYIYY